MNSYNLLLSGKLKNIKLAHAMQEVAPSTTDGLYQFLLDNPPTSIDDTIKTLKQGVREIRNEIMEMFSKEVLTKYLKQFYSQFYICLASGDSIELDIRKKFDKADYHTTLGVFTISFNDGIHFKLLKTDECRYKSLEYAKQYHAEVSKCLVDMEQHFNNYMESIKKEYEVLLTMYLFSNEKLEFLENSVKTLTRTLKHNKFLKKLDKVTKDNPAIFGDENKPKEFNYQEDIICVKVDSVNGKKAFRHIWSCKNSSKYDYTINQKKSMNRSLDVLFGEVEHLIEV